MSRGACGPRELLAHDREHHRVHVLHVDRARPQTSRRHLAGERVKGPVRGVGRHDVQVAVHQQRGPLGSCPRTGPPRWPGPGADSSTPAPARPRPAWRRRTRPRPAPPAPMSPRFSCRSGSGRCRVRLPRLRLTAGTCVFVTAIVALTPLAVPRSLPARVNRDSRDPGPGWAGSPGLPVAGPAGTDLPLVAARIFAASGGICYRDAADTGSAVLRRTSGWRNRQTR